MDILETIDLPTSTLDFTEKGTDKLLLEWVNATRWLTDDKYLDKKPKTLTRKKSVLSNTVYTVDDNNSTKSISSTSSSSSSSSSSSDDDEPPTPTNSIKFLPLENHDSVINKRDECLVEKKEEVLCSSKQHTVSSSPSDTTVTTTMHSIQTQITLSPSPPIFRLHSLLRKNKSKLANLFTKKSKKEETTSKKKALLPPPIIKEEKKEPCDNYARYPFHTERAIYRLAHSKLANPRRSLQQQVVISNMMFWYLSILKQQHPHLVSHKRPTTIKQATTITTFPQQKPNKNKYKPIVNIHYNPSLTANQRVKN